ncbi:hypothetical protein I302_103100 [Kwoniella bestiolae CBS 10118]|uniref:Prephenate dehydratase domain-containing protein n=1 Tax=Kwoniella bestiolae CBS 10118 TaxID=1296100 RepID=A0A1B9GGU4_9TREE|nr:hypothetical protein I302_01801 [Kwoniella bestiolae CBS 10118]OCF30282.1 hypothetical protein I302_01801 [Kwoniella bestiolae CBS 10118]
MTAPSAISNGGEPSAKRPRLADHGDETGDGKTTYTMAYLGPEGTYGQMAAEAFKSCYDNDVPIELIPCPSISAIWKTSSTFHVFPLENTIHGGVTETLDCLLSNLNPDKGMTELDEEKKSRKIIADLALPISHCLVVRKGVKKEDIKWIRSHEQALGQSSKFIETHFPTAKLKTYPSTAGAAVSLINDLDEGEGKGAALCSKAAAKLYEDKLDVLYQGTQGISNNFTRFVLLSNHYSRPPPEATTTFPPYQSTEFYAIPSASDIIAFFQSSQIRNIHSRPSPSTSDKDETQRKSTQWTYREERFPTLYFVEVDAASDSNNQSETSKRGEEKGWFLGKAGWRVTDAQINAL